MSANRKLIPAVLVSLLLHGVLAWLIDSPREPTAPPVRLELVLTTAPAGADVSTPPEPAEVPPDLALRPARSTETLATPTVPDREPPAPVREPPRAPVRLNLQRPSDWEDLVSGIPPSGSSPRLAFNRGLEAALGARLAARERRVLLAERGAAVYGVTDESYTRDGAWGTRTKQDGRCVTLVEDPVEGGTRWWAGACTETRRKPFALEALEYDGRGRAVAD